MSFMGALSFAAFGKSDQSIPATEDMGFPRAVVGSLQDVDRHVLEGRRMVSQSDASLIGLFLHVYYDRAAKSGLE